MRLEDTTALVTGAARGLGRAMADGFVREGASVACVDVDAEALEATVADLEGPGAATPVVGDVGSWPAVRSMVGRARRDHGAIDLLVNNAGVKQLTLTGDERPTWAVPVGTWDEVLATNLRGSFLCVRAIVPAMVDRGSGRVLTVTSGHGVSARTRRAPYVASKFGLEGLARTLALDLEGTGVDSLAFTPPGGGVRTGEARYVEDPASFSHDPAVVVEPAVRLAAGGGDNGDRYRATSDGEGLELTHSAFD